MLGRFELRRLPERYSSNSTIIYHTTKFSTDEAFSNPILDAGCSSCRLSWTSHAQLCAYGNAGQRKVDIRVPFSSRSMTSPRRFYQESCQFLVSPPSLHVYTLLLNFYPWNVFSNLYIQRRKSLLLKISGRGATA